MLNIPESIDSVQVLAPVTIIAGKAVAAISIVLNGLESVLMLVGGNMAMDSFIRHASGYSLERIYKKATRRLGFAEPRCGEQQEEHYADKKRFLHHTPPHPLHIR